MNNKWRILFASLAASVVLAACGTNNTNPEEETPAENPAVPEVDSEADNGNAAPGEQTETDSGELEGAVETASDEQDFSMQVLPGYTLTSEEPGKDSLYAEEDDAVFMRIEAADKNDSAFTFDEWYDNLGETLKASDESAEVTEIADAAQVLQNDRFLQVKGQTAESENSYLTGYVIELEDKLIRATIFAPENNERVKDLQKMAATIQ